MSAAVLDFEAARQERAARAAQSDDDRYMTALARQRDTDDVRRDIGRWKDRLEVCCAYASKLKADHEAESAAVHFDALTRGLRNWSEADDLRDRVDVNNHLWNLYRACLQHLAALPAPDQRTASLKRYTIGRQWLACGGDWYDRLRAGCEQDDHLFPPSRRLRRNQA